MERIKGSPINDGIVIGRLYGFGKEMPTDPKDAVIVLAEELTPQQVLTLCRVKADAFVMRVCSETSHAAILARGADLPSLFGIAFEDAWQGKLAIVDGYEGVLIVDPDRATLDRYAARLLELRQHRELLRLYKGKSSRTKSGTAVRLCANINKPSDIVKAIRNDAEGVFFKTEFLFLESDSYPSEDEQFEVYKTIAKAMAGKPTVIRTADIGADKTAPYFGLANEENPALGLRGIRLSLLRREWFILQLRAILRASAFGKVAIMFPMIASESEVIAAKNAVREAMRSLDEEGVPYDRAIRIGIMIETPAAAILSRELASLVDFFSIGTNDLIQYTLAADRQNPNLEAVYDPYHPAVLSLVRYVIESATSAGIEVGISGELGADLTLTERFIAYGMKVFALPPAKILLLRKKICEMK